MKKRLATLVALPAALLVPAGAALAVSAGTFGAALHAVPHDHVADGGSNVTGQAALRLTGRQLDVRISATGLTPNETHAMHIHGVTTATNECPTIDADANTGDPIDPGTVVEGVPDGLISLSEGLPDYGPIDVSLTTRGPTGPRSGLDLERFIAADAEGAIEYHRSVTVPQDVAKNLDNLHIVIHGADLPGDADGSSQNSVFEATLPVACGEIDRITR
jgi:hypothetical protein